MKILVTDGTGNVGGAVVKELLKRGAKVRVLARKQPEEGKLSAGVEVAIGDLLDPGRYRPCDSGGQPHGRKFLRVTEVFSRPLHLLSARRT